MDEEKKLAESLKNFINNAKLQFPEDTRLNAISAMNDSPQGTLSRIVRWANSNKVAIPKDLNVFLKQGPYFPGLSGQEDTGFAIRGQSKSRQSPHDDGALIKKKPPAVRFYLALKNKAIEDLSNNRESLEYLQLKGLSKKEVFDKWYKEKTALGKPLTDEETQLYKESEGYKKKVKDTSDQAFAKKHREEIRGLIDKEISTIYEKDKDGEINDPALKELKKIISEKDGKYTLKAVEKFNEIFPQKAIAYSEDVPEIRQVLSEARKEELFSPPIILSSSSESGDDNYSSGDGDSSENEDNSIYPQNAQDEGSNDQDQDSSSSGRNRDRGKKEQKATKKAARREAKLGKKGGKKGLMKLGKGALQIATKIPPQVWVVIIVLIVLLVLILLLFGPLDDSLNNGGVSISKTADKEAVDNPPDDPAYSTAVATPQDITYTITVSYSGETQAVTVTDPIPKNALFISASDKPTLKDAQGNTIKDPSQYNLVSQVEWFISAYGEDVAPDDILNYTYKKAAGVSGGQASPSTNFTFDQDKFSSYGFPTPLDGFSCKGCPPSNPTSEQISRWKTDIMPYVPSVSEELNIDMGIIGMWILYEQNPSVFYDNCHVEKGGDLNPNTPCSDPIWQVGYGVQVMDEKGNLQEAFDKMHAGETVQSIGQKVIDNSSSDSKGKITYPFQAFPDVNISDIVNNSSDPANRSLIATLMKDPAINAYLIGKTFKGKLQGSESLAQQMEGWGSYYNSQLIINYIKTIYDAGITGGDTNSSKTFTLVLRPKIDTKDTYIINQAFADGIGGSVCTGGSTIVIDPGHPSEVGIGGSGNGTNEVEKVLEVANILKPKLEAKGYSVILTRNDNTTVVTNKKRAETANSANASLMFRIHTDAARAQRGAAYYYPAKQGTVNGVTGPSSDVIEKSKQAASDILSATKDPLINSGMPLFRGGLLTDAYTYQGDLNGGALAGSIYSTVPTVLVELGSLTNATDVIWLKSTDNLNKYADSLAIGISNYTGASSCTNATNGSPTNSVGIGGNTPLQGQWSGTAQQLSNYLLLNNPSPKFTVSSLTLAGYYIKYAAEAKLRADILWAQMIHETGFGKYGGDVLPSQNNFAGVGATGGGKEGISFATAEDGIKAQIAHMAAYVYTTDIAPWTNSQTDTRYNLVSPRGVAKILSDLDGRWANPGIGYGATIENHVRNINK